MNGLAQKRLSEWSRWRETGEGEKPSFAWLDFRGANLSEADLIGANFSGADLSGAYLSEADLIGADLSEANLSYADLSDANLSHANLSYDNLIGANLSRANFSDANLSDADLSEADLRGANLNADLKNTDITIANFGRHTAIYTGGDTLNIGCRFESLSWWLENYVEVGEREGYSVDEIEAYGCFIRKCVEGKGDMQ